MITVDELVEIVRSGDSRITAYRIDNEIKEYPIELSTVEYYIAEAKQTIKIEGLEHYLTEFKPRTVHCFIAAAGAPSFPEHKDITDVTIFCVSGTKTMEIEGDEYVIHEGQTVFIPEGTVHRATNKYDSIMLSVG